MSYLFCIKVPLKTIPPLFNLAVMYLRKHFYFFLWGSKLKKLRNEKQLFWDGQTHFSLKIGYRIFTKTKNSIYYKMLFILSPNFTEAKIKNLLTQFIKKSTLMMFQFSSDLQQNELIITFKKEFESKLRSQK
jgi:hypothetical protein